MTAVPEQLPSRIGAYSVEAELGRGAMSIVYRARRDGERYALKVMLTDSAVDALDLSVQFRREAAAIARLRHPVLTRIIEVGEHEGRPFMVMELADGENLEDRIRREPLSDAETITVGKALAGALAEVHRFGLVHRDVKPANVVLGRTGAVRLIDFGLVSETTDAESVVGTLSYAAPEQLGLLKRTVGATADLYALGATLFECLTGRPPIEGEDQGDFLQRVATTPAPALLEVRPSTRPALSAIVARLLAKDPDDRYQTARGLLADLTGVDALDEAFRQGSAPRLGSQDHLMAGDQDVPLIGRADEMRAVEAAWKRARSGEVTFLQIEGESGSGKTRLAREMIARATREGALVLSGKCQELETVPFGPLREAADQHAARLVHLPEVPREAAIARVRQAAGDLAPLVKRLSVGLARIIGDVPDLRALDPDSEQQRFYDAIAGFFPGLGTAEAPLVLVVDDIQWLDEGSLRVLGRLAGGAGGAHILVLSTARNNAAYAAARNRFRDVVRTRSAERLDLKALDTESVGALIAARLGGRPLDRPTVEKLAALTHGNPFAVGEYLRALLDAGVIRPSDDRWVTDAEAMDAVKLPKDVVELVVGRLFSLGREAVRVIGIAGLVGSRFSLMFLARVAGTGLDGVGRCMEELMRAGLVEHTEADQYAFVHDRVREASVDRLSDQQQRETHQAIAEVLETSDDDSAPHLYALARHFAQGVVEKNPRRVAETNLAAGLRALEDHANEDAFEMLDRAHGVAQRAGIFEEVAPRLLESLGRACAMTGRLERAFTHLEEALRVAATREDRFRLEYLLTLTYASQGRNDDALRSLYQAIAVKGRPYSQSVVVQVVSLVWFWVLGILLRGTGFRYASARGEALERRRILSQLHWIGSMIALFQGRPLLMVYFIVRDAYNVHFIGPSVETAVTTATYGTVMATLQLKKVSEKYNRLGIEMAEQLGDPGAVIVCRAYQAVAVKWAGDLARGNEELPRLLPELHRQVPGSWYAAMFIAEQAYSLLHVGHSLAAIDHVRANAAQLERTNNLMYRYNVLSVQYAEMMVCGDVGAANTLWEELERQFKPLANTVYVQLARVIAVLEVAIDKGETGPHVDEAIEAFHHLVSEDYYSNFARVLSGYARMLQYLAAPAAERPAARARLIQASRSLGLRALWPVFSCHPLIWRAVVARVEGRFEDAWRLLGRADRLASRCDSRRGAFYVALERARLARDSRDSAARAFAQAALDVATASSWRQKAQQVRAEFGIAEERQTRTVAPAPVSTGTVVVNAERSRRFMDVLLQVSLASASSLDLDTQAHNALVEVARALGAERALFFLVDPRTGALDLKASTGTGASAVSQTVVHKVVETRAPLVLTGTEDGEMLGAKSIVAHGLRSIIAAPVMLRDSLLGVLYLDNRLARGVFSEEDLSLLLAVSNHIAIAVETARNARLEAERLAMRRDFELLGAVQSLLLPRASRFRTPTFSGGGFYSAAAQCGGDWWWQEQLPGGAHLLVLGDVSGHGAGPAMVTSAVASTFHTMRRLLPEVEPPVYLDQVDRQVKTFGGGFHMTLSVIRIDPSTCTLRWWSAGAPPLFIQRGSAVECLPGRGRVLGDPEAQLEIGEQAVPFGPGDRLLVFTDGLPELKRPDGRDLGIRRASQMFARLGPVPVDEVPDRLGNEVRTLLGGREQDDDITFVVIESTPSLLPQPTP